MSQQSGAKEPASKLQKVSTQDGRYAAIEKNGEAAADSDDDSDNENGGKTKIKWKSLEHHGVIFFPPYQPHGVKILHKGAPIPLSQEQEEACNWWAQIEGSEFALKEKVYNNFEKTLLSMFDPKMGITSIKNLDFTPIKTYLDQ